MSLQQAIEAARVMSHNHPASFAPQHSYLGRVDAEVRIQAREIAGLRELGHVVREVGPWAAAMAAVPAVVNINPAIVRAP